MLIRTRNTGSLNVSWDPCLASLKGLLDYAARDDIQRMGLAVGSETMEPSDTVPYGTVESASLESNGQVALVESEGDHTVPDFRGDQLNYADGQIEADGLNSGNVTDVYGCGSSGTVAGQDPPAGSYYDPANPPAINFTEGECSSTP
jgi:beta-lactam-binding protein with PASTA domain